MGGWSKLAGVVALAGQIALRFCWEGAGRGQQLREWDGSAMQAKVAGARSPPALPAARGGREEAGLQAPA